MSLSGEIYFKSEGISNSSSSSSNSSYLNSSLSNIFLDLLYYDSNITSTRQELYNQLTLLKKSRLHTRKTFQIKLEKSKLLLKLLNMKREQVNSLVLNDKERKTQKSKELLQLYDQKLMEITLEYGGLLTYELEMSRVNIRAESVLVESLQRQAKTAYQMKLFAKYISLETRGLVTLTTLSKDSEQYKRCKKAIKDNISATFLRKGSYQGVRVLNVYHLDNQKLSKILQNVVQLNPNGKVRGMFCAIPRQSIYSACVYGLHSENFESTSTTSSLSNVNSLHSPNSSPNSKLSARNGNNSPSLNSPQKQQQQQQVTNRKKKNMLGTTIDPILRRNMFEWSWYCYPPTTTTSTSTSILANTNTNIRNNNYIRQSIQNDDSNFVPLVKGIGTAMKFVNNSTQSLTTTPYSYIRFTRSSTPSSLLLSEMSSEDSSISEEGCYLGLCRILINSIYTIPNNGEFNSYEIMEATRRGCDAVYCEKSDEYVLLNPQYCLPEFLIHIQLVKNFESTAEAEIHNFYSTLQNRIQNVTKDFSNYSDLNTSQPSSKQRYEWLQQVDHILSLNRNEVNMKNNEVNGTKVESDTITKRKRQLIRAVIDETREMLTKIRDTKKNSIEINLGIGGGENIQENINKL